MCFWLVGLAFSSNGTPAARDTHEVSNDEVARATQALESELNPNSQVIISMRWRSLDEQMTHFLFGAAIAYALNRSFVVEMRRYPLDKPQPPFLLNFQEIVPKMIDPPNFVRLRVARELFCKTEHDFAGVAEQVPILVRNFDDISSLYGNHFIGGRLREMFGMHAAFFLGHKYLSGMDVTEKRNVLGVDARSFVKVKRMKHLKDAKYIAGNFSRAINELNKGNDYEVVIVTNDTKVMKELQALLPKAVFVEDDIKGFCSLVASKVFLGTYRSKISNLVNAMRGRAGLLLNTDTGDVLKMSNSQAGILSPFLQDVEDVEYTVNEKLRGCSDNIEDLRLVLENFVL